MSAHSAGTSVAEQFGLSQAPTLFAKTTLTSPIAFTRLRNDGEFHGRTMIVPPDEAFSFQVALAPMALGDLWIGGRHGGLTASPGDTFVFDLTASTVARLPPPYDYFRFYLATAALDEIAQECGLQPVRGLRARRIGVQDEIMHHLALMLAAVLQQTTKPTTLFLDSIALAFRAHAIHTYGGIPIGRDNARNGLAPWQLRRVEDFIEEHLHGDPSVTDLAKECRLSTNHFARAFQRSSGFPPHRYLLKRRVDRAKEMLLEGQISLAEIALSCGFGDQSHFTRIFARSEGCSPGKWRRLRRH